MATTVGWTKKAARRKAGNLVVQKTGVQLSSETLGKALLQMRRLPKLRSCEEVDGIVWADARATAEKEMVEELKIQMQCEDYYLKMCSVGQFLFVKEVHTKTQRIYDYRAIKLFKKQERSNQGSRNRTTGKPTAAATNPLVYGPGLTEPRALRSTARAGRDGTRTAAPRAGKKPVWR